MLISAVGAGDICTIPILWDGTTDYKGSLTVSLDVQVGDLIEVNLTMACAGFLQWSCACRSGTASFLTGNAGFYTGDTLDNLDTHEDRLWTTVLQSNATQTLTIGIDHSKATLGSQSAGSWTSGIISGLQGMVGYRITNVTLAMCVIGKNY